MAERRARVGLAALFLTAATISLAPSPLATVLGRASSAATDLDDHYKPANTTIIGRSSLVSIAIPPTTPGFTWQCTNSVIVQKTPATGLGTFKISPPTYNDGPGKPCRDNYFGTDTVISHGTWSVGFIDAPNDETGKEPNVGDRLKFIVPAGGVVVTTSAGCTITFAPNGPLSAIGTYDDVKTFTVIGVVPIKAAGGIACPVGSTVTAAAFSVTYTLTPGLSDAS